MTKLSVNINKIATIRNSRGGNSPDLIKVATDIVKFGAEGITVHPRPDERHIKRSDVYALKPILEVEFNIEGYPSRQFLNLVSAIKPQQVTLVPDAPNALTSNAGWDVIKNFNFLKAVVKELQQQGIRTSIFVDPVITQVEKAAETLTDRIELYTEAYASNYPKNKEEAIHSYFEASKKANELGLGINAGHDLSLENLKYFAQIIPNLLEVSIGHALISDALYFGLENTVQLYLKQLIK